MRTGLPAVARPGGPTLAPHRRWHRLRRREAHDQSGGSVFRRGSARHMATGFPGDLLRIGASMKSPRIFQWSWFALGLALAVAACDEGTPIQVSGAPVGGAGNPGTGGSGPVDGQPNTPDCAPPRAWFPLPTTDFGELVVGTAGEPLTISALYSGGCADDVTLPSATTSSPEFRISTQRCGGSPRKCEIDV